MINSSGFFMLYDEISAWIPNSKNNNENKAIKMFFPHQNHEPIKLILS
jgi:hypothetical protein